MTFDILANTQLMEITITDNNGKVVTKSDVKSMNHYLMLLNKLKDKNSNYQVLFKEGRTQYTRVISVK